MTTNKQNNISLHSNMEQNTNTSSYYNSPYIEGATVKNGQELYGPFLPRSIESGGGPGQTVKNQTSTPSQNTQSKTTVSTPVQTSSTTQQQYKTPSQSYQTPSQSYQTTSQSYKAPSQSYQTPVAQTVKNNSLAYDEEALFNKIKSGELTPGSEQWKSLYENGQATQAMKNAYKKWDDTLKQGLFNWNNQSADFYFNSILSGNDLRNVVENENIIKAKSRFSTANRFKGADENTIYNALVSGQLSDVGQAWDDLIKVSGGETQAMKNAKTRYSQKITTDTINSSVNSLYNSVKGEDTNRRNYIEEISNNMKKALGVSDENTLTDEQRIANFRKLLEGDEEQKKLAAEIAEGQEEINRLHDEADSKVRELKKLYPNTPYSTLMAIAARENEVIYDKIKILERQLTRKSSDLQYRQGINSAIVNYQMQLEQQRDAEKRAINNMINQQIISMGFSNIKEMREKNMELAKNIGNLPAVIGAISEQVVGGLQNPDEWISKATEYLQNGMSIEALPNALISDMRRRREELIREGVPGIRPLELITDKKIEFKEVDGGLIKVTTNTRTGDVSFSTVISKPSQQKEYKTIELGETTDIYGNKTKNMALFDPYSGEIMPIQNAFSSNNVDPFLIGQPYINFIGTGKITQYGYHNSGIKGDMGLDIDGDVGDPIFNPYDITVKKVGYDEIFGNHVTVEDSLGNTLKYNHLNKIYVKEGDKVDRGTIFAEIGNTGRVLNNKGNVPTKEELANGSGAHLDIWIKPKGSNRWLDPEEIASFISTTYGYDENGVAYGKVAKKIRNTVPEDKAKLFMRDIATYVSQGLYDDANDAIKSAYKESLTADERKKVVSKTKLLYSLNKIEEKLNELEMKGVKPGIIQGISVKIGDTINVKGVKGHEELIGLDIFIQSTIDDFMRDKTGAAILKEELTRYEKLFASVFGSYEINMARLLGLRDKIKQDLGDGLKDYVGEDNYNTIFKYGAYGENPIKYDYKY